MKDVIMEIIYRICYKIYKFVYSSFVTNTTFGGKKDYYICLLLTYITRVNKIPSNFKYINKGTYEYFWKSEVRVLGFWER